MEEKPPSPSPPIESPTPRIAGGLLLVGLSALGFFWLRIFEPAVGWSVESPTIFLLRVSIYGGPFLAGLLRIWGAPWTRLPACVAAACGVVIWFVPALIVLAPVPGAIGMRVYVLATFAGCVWQAIAAANCFRRDRRKGLFLVCDTHLRWMKAIFALFCGGTGAFLLLLPDSPGGVLFVGVISLYGLFAVVSLMIRRVHSPEDSPVLSTLLIVFAAIVIGGAVRFVRVAVTGSPFGPRRVTARDNLLQIGFLLDEYVQKQKYSPPQALLDQNGSALFSWRYAIVREEKDYYSGFRAQEPWDSEPNLTAARAVQHHPFRPERPKDPEEKRGDACCLALLAEDGFWQTDGKGFPRKRIRDFGRMPIVIALRETDILWTEPRDIRIADLLSGKLPWNETIVDHRTTDFLLLGIPLTHVLLGDGSVETLSGRPTREEIAALFSADKEDRREAIYRCGFADSGDGRNWPAIGVFGLWFGCWVLLVGWTFVKRGEVDL